MFRFVVATFLFLIVPYYSWSESVTAPVVQEHHVSPPPFSDWRRVVMVAGLVLASSLALVCFFAHSPLYSASFFALTLVIAFGAYYVWQVASLKSLHEEVVTLRETRELFQSQSSALFRDLDGFLEQLHLKTETLNQNLQTQTGSIQEQSDRLKSAADLVFQRFEELLQDDALQKKQKELERLAQRLGEYTGKIEVAARQLPRLEALVNAFEEKLKALAATEGGLSASSTSLDKSIEELRSLLREMTTSPHVSNTGPLKIGKPQELSR